MGRKWQLWGSLTQFGKLPYFQRFLAAQLLGHSEFRHIQQLTYIKPVDIAVAFNIYFPSALISDNLRLSAIHPMLPSVRLSTILFEDSGSMKVVQSANPFSRLGPD